MTRTDSGRSVFQRFKTDRRMSPCRPKSGLTNKTRLGEDSRGVNSPLVPTESFSRPGCKPIGCWLAVGPSYRGDVAVRRAVAASKQQMEIDAPTETGQSHRPMITLGHRSSQVVVRVFWGSSEGEGGFIRRCAPLPLERPPSNVYSIEGSHGGVV